MSLQLLSGQRQENLLKKILDKLVTLESKTDTLALRMTAMEQKLGKYPLPELALCHYQIIRLLQHRSDSKTQKKIYIYVQLLHFGIIHYFFHYGLFD